MVVMNQTIENILFVFNNSVVEIININATNYSNN